MLSEITKGVDKSLLELLMFDRVKAGQIPENSFTDLLTVCQENPGFVEVLKTLQSTGAEQFQALLMLGPQGILTLTGALAQANVISRKEIKTATGIKTATKKEPVWYKEITKDILKVAWASCQEAYAENLEANRSKWGDVVPETMPEMFRASGASNISTSVDHWDHPQTAKKCPLAMIFRIDYNQAARNGVKDAEKAAAKVNGAGEAAPAE